MRQQPAKSQCQSGAKASARRRVAVITGTRAEYGLLRSTMVAIQRHSKLQLQLVVTGTHLLKKFGGTVADIVADGFTVDARIPMQRGDDSPLDQAEGLGRGVAGIARFLQRAKTDIVVVLGDRIEALAGALAGVTTGRIVAHIHGGDVAPGDFDDVLRHAITKLAHVHFPATASAARRIIRLGESPQRVHMVGAPGLDRLRELIAERGRPRTIPSRKDDIRALIVQHPCGRAAAVEKRVMEAILRAVDKAKMTALCIYPNSDRGHRGIIEAIESHRRRVDPSRFRTVRSLPRDGYLAALIDADILIGNSSSGIIEAPAAGTAVVNVGRRQQGRQPGGAAIVHCGESPAAIAAAIRAALRKRPITGGSGIHGAGHAGDRIAKALASFPLDDQARHKTMVF